MYKQDFGEKTDSAFPSLLPLWLAVFAVFVFLYGITCQQGVSWQDSGMFQLRILNADLYGRLGLALAHPLYIAAGQVLKVIPFGDLAWRLNFFSGLGMAVALANISCVGARLTDRRWIGLMVALMLGTAHTVWWLSTIAEVYTWSVAGLTAELWILFNLIREPTLKKAGGLALVNGIGLTIHNFSLLTLPVHALLLVWLVTRDCLPGKALLVALLSYIAGGSLFIGMTISEAFSSGSLITAVKSALFSHYGEAVFNVAGMSSHPLANFGLSGLNFVSFLLPLAVVGWIFLFKRLDKTTAVVLSAITVIELLFFIRYSVPDQFTFILPSLTMIALAAAIGIRVISEKSAAWHKAVAVLCVLSVFMPPIIYAAGPRLMEITGIDISRSRKLPYRNETRYWLKPWKHNEESAQRFVENAMEQAAPNGVIMASSTAAYPLLYYNKKEKPESDVTILYRKDFPDYNSAPEEFREQLAGRPLYIVSPVKGYAPSQLLNDAEFKKQPGEALYLVKW